MASKKGETRQCANTNRVSMSETLRETNMNTIAKSDFNFQGFAFSPITENGEFWFTSTDLAKALGYKKTDAISQIYARNADEFSNSMSMTLSMRVNGINNSLRHKLVRVYSMRGAHLVAMFATTGKAKEFRKWVLDILDREVELKPEASPLHRYYVKVIIRDTLFGSDVEFLGKANTFEAIASGIATDLGFEPTGFIGRRPATEKMMRKH
ncbi:BRO-N domain-containing protein [Serratia sp. IR-2025]